MPAPPTYRVRPATVDDLEELLALLNDPGSIHRREACRHRQQPESAQQLFDRLVEDENLVLEVDGEIAGYASWQRYGRHAHLNLMTVAGRFQRQGLGKALFEALKETMLEEGVGSLSLRAFQDSPWALAFYERQGLRRYRPGDEKQAADEGFLHYLRLAIANGQWPAADKVTYFCLLPSE